MDNNKRGAAEPISHADNNKKAKHGKATDDKNIGGAKYCETCEMWLPNPEQWEKHKHGAKHFKNWTEKNGYKNL